jgi:outer membrane receptor protein involved in Fe transport
VEEHKDHPPQELRGLFKASLPFLEKGTFFLEAKRWMENPNFASLYVQNDYMEPEEDLLPARKAEYGIGVEYHPGGSLSLEAKAFYQDSEDLIVLGDEDEDDLYSPVNLDGRILGVRSEITHYTGSRLVQRLSLLYRDPRAEEGKTIPFIPNLEVEYLLRYFTPWGFEILLNPRYSGESMDGLKDSTAKEIPSYLLVDAKISQRLLKDRLTLFIYGENILGEDYMVRRNYPGPPALFGFGLRLRF